MGAYRCAMRAVLRLAVYRRGAGIDVSLPGAPLEIFM